MTAMLTVSGLAKSFRLHLQGGTLLSVIERASFDVAAGQCAVLAGPSGSGKSSILKMVYGTYPCDRGEILVTCRGGPVDVAKADASVLRRLRRDTIGYVSQFLRVIPARRHPGRGGGAADRTGPPARRGEGARRRSPDPPQPARTPLGPAAGDLLRRRAAAGQHRQGAGASLPLVAARRAHRLAGWPRTGRPWWH